MRIKTIAENLFFLGVIVLALVLGACSNQLLPMPVFQSSQADREKEASGSPWGAPGTLTASQGKKRAVTLSWEPVDGAVRYVIYKSESPLQDFIQCGETADDTPEFEIHAAPGAVVYYKAAAVNRRNEVSPQSGWVIGRSLAQPVIYSIEPNADDGAGSVIVYWSMNNLEPNTYEEKIRYTLYCYEGSAEKARVSADGSFVHDPFAKVFGLSGGMEYEFQVEAWLEDAASEKEASEKVDAETARRMNPGAPIDLETVPGGEKQSVTLSFKLPEKVEVLETVSGMREYVPHSIYFVISRRAESSAASFETLCGYLGEGPAKPGTFNPILIDPPYTPGAAVSWTDTTIREEDRGQKYEYRVQSYVDGIDKTVTSSAAAALVTGWAMAQPAVFFSSPVYTEDGGVYVSAVLPLEFSHDQNGVEYEYKVRGTIEPIGDGHANDASAPIVWDEGPFTLTEMQAYATTIDLTGQTGSGRPGRGIYSYSVDVLLKGGAEVIETSHTVGVKRIFEKNLAYLIIENFTVKDGYTGQFILAWKKKSGLIYKLAWAPAAAGPWAPLEDLPAGAADDDDFTYIVAGQDSGINRYFSICAYDAEDNQGDTVYSPAAQTLGTPDPGLTGSLSYDAIRLAWTPVQKADNYRIFYKYAEEPNFTSTALIPAASLSLQAGKYVYNFKPLGSAGIDAAQAGKVMAIQVEALNEARRLADGGGEVKTVSQLISGARLFGPAGLEQPGALTATQNISVNDIIVTWKTVQDAAGYYVVRRQGQLNSGLSGGGETFYYVDAGTHRLTGVDVRISGNAKEDSDEVSAELAFANGVYTLTDKALSDAEYAVKKADFGVYADEQNDISWGYPYHYYIVPVLSKNDIPSIGSDKTCAVGGVTYSGISMAPLEKTGRVLGFVTDVRADKGTLSGPGDDGEAANIGVRVSWTRPDIEGELSYIVFRRAQIGMGNWDQLTFSPPLTGLYYDDLFGKTGGPQSGTAYEYLVGVSANGVSSRPDKNARFIDKSREAMDDDFPGERKIAGYVLSQPAMKSASRIAQGNETSGYYETVEFYSTGVDSLNSARKDRGIDGYAIQVRDQSHQRAWKTIRYIPIGDADPETYTEDIQNNHADNENNGLLNVLRDYRHYYRVRTYVDYGGKILSPPPPDPGLGGAENQYIKWGARPITATEFAGLTSLAIGTAIAGTECSPALYELFGKTVNKSINGTVFFLNAGGSVAIKANSPLSGGSITEYSGSNLTFSSPDAPFNYGGSVTISGLTSDEGSYKVTFGGSTVTVERKFIGKPFAFGGKVTQNCDNIYDWDPAGGWQ